MRDLYSNIGSKLALAPAVYSAAGNGLTIDTIGFGRVAFVLATGAIVSAGDFGAKVQHSDTTVDGDFVDVPAGFFDTNAPATLAAASAYKLGYRGTKRYVRLAYTKAGGTSIALSANAVLADPASSPVA